MKTSEEKHEDFKQINCYQLFDDIKNVRRYFSWKSAMVRFFMGLVPTVFDVGTDFYYATEIKSSKMMITLNYTLPIFGYIEIDRGLRFCMETYFVIALPGIMMILRGLDNLAELIP